MKKLATILLALTLAMTLTTAFATEVPSITASDVAQVTEVVTESGDSFNVEIVEATPEIVEQLETIAAAVENNEPILSALTAGDEEKTAALTEAIVAVLPEDKAVEELQLIEFLPTQVTEYDPDEFGGATVVMETATIFEDDQPVVAMVCIDEEWYVLPVTVVEGRLHVQFTQEILTLMNGNTYPIAILA